MHHRAIAKERSHHVQALATRGLNAVLLATHGLGAAVGVNLRKADLIEVGQSDLAVLRLRPQQRLAQQQHRLGAFSRSPVR